MNGRYLYDKMPAEVTPADVTKDMIIHALDGALMFRVYHDGGCSTDYEIRHDDLSVAIDNDELATFYRACPRVDGDGEGHILDHSPRCWG